MCMIFSGVYVFNEDLSRWDTSNVTTMENMFDGARAFTVISQSMGRKQCDYHIDEMKYLLAYSSIPAKV